MPRSLLVFLVATGACATEDDPKAGGSGAVDADGDGYGGDSDCDDASAAVHPGADERCDGLDNDCDGVIDEDPVDGEVFFVDADGDGHGGPETTTAACALGTGLATAGDDCDDTDPAVSPSAVEVCDPADRDEDCDGLADDADDSVDPDSKAPWFSDLDGDGHGAGEPVLACDDPGSSDTAYSPTGDDCDDGDDGISPSATERCDDDDVDEDCDGLADDADDSVDPTTLATWYRDTDGDGHGTTTATVGACDDPSTETEAWSAWSDDCDDSRADVRPGGQEVCDDDDADEDCDTLSDDLDPSVDTSTHTEWHVDADGDGYGNPAGSTAACDAPTDDGRTFVADATDCDDADADVNPAAQEVCDPDDVDEDCSGAADDADPSVDPTTTTSWYPDGDTDGHGASGASAVSACDAPTTGGTAWAATDDDCDDGDADVSPSASEVCDPDDVDEDCSGAADDADPGIAASSLIEWYIDADGDGHGDEGGTPVSQCADPSTAGTTYVADGSDCDDGDADVSPSATEICDPDDVDEDCDGVADDADPSLDASSATAWFPDGDLDGYGDETASPVSACEDPSGATTAYVDDDTDCDDGDADINPGATEVYGDGTDQTCDGADVPGFACSGYTVPGSYASIGAASAALGNSPTVQTICLTGTTYTENPTIRGNLRIIGPSQYDTRINGRVTFASGRAGSTIELQGVTISNGVYVEDGSSTFSTTLSDCILEDTNNHNIHVERNGYGTPNFAVRRCIIEARSTASAVYLYDYGYNSTDRVSLEIRDNYISGGSYTVRTAVTKSSSRRTYQSVTIVNNTIEGGNYGLWMIGRYTPFQIKNNILVDNARAFHWDGGGSMNNDFNLYFGNSTNFSGSATGGANRVTADPLLSAEVPPVPATGGVADGAGTTSYASTVDYWTNPRPSPPSIGAVEPL